jgi:plasmid stabilization system protein ParE
MYSVVILPSAKEDIQNAAKWYNKRSTGLGRRFSSEVRLVTKQIQENPNTFNIRYKDIRTAVLKNFPFMIHYLIDEKNENIVILAVFHTSLNPIKWFER